MSDEHIAMEKGTAERIAACEKWLDSRDGREAATRGSDFAAGWNAALASQRDRIAKLESDLVKCQDAFDERCREADKRLTMLLEYKASQKQPQTEATCKHGHPMWALVEEPKTLEEPPPFPKCSICESLRAEREKWVEGLQGLESDWESRDQVETLVRYTLIACAAKLAALRERLEKS